jgi:hypothetical protein
VIGEGGGSNNGKGIKPVALLSHIWCWAVIDNGSGVMGLKVRGGAGRGIKYSTRTKRERGSHMVVAVSL